MGKLCRGSSGACHPFSKRRFEAARRANFSPTQTLATRSDPTRANADIHQRDVSVSTNVRHNERADARSVARHVARRRPGSRKHSREPAHWSRELQCTSAHIGAHMGASSDLPTNYKGRHSSLEGRQPNGRGQRREGSSRLSTDWSMVARPQREINENVSNTSL